MSDTPRLHSMTGFGAASFSLGPRRYELELKSVNHRFLDLRFHLPRGFAALEDELSRLLKARLARGHVELSVRTPGLEAAAVDFSLDEDAARSLHASLLALRERFSLPDAPTLALMSSFREVFALREQRPDDAALRPALLDALARALDALAQMRAAEGASLAAELRARVAAARALVDDISKRAPLVLAQRHQRLLTKVQSLLSETRGATPEALHDRVAIEVAVVAERGDITEELARLQAHLAQVEDALLHGGPQGKRLDFLVQELHREANTLGSKSQDSELGRLVIALKAEVERIREQIQNVE